MELCASGRGRHPRPREVPGSEPFALICDACGEPLLPNLSQADVNGCLWICIDPECPELRAGELETEDLVAGGVPQALAARLGRLIDFYEDSSSFSGSVGAKRACFLASLSASSMSANSALSESRRSSAQRSSLSISVSNERPSRAVISASSV